MSKRNKGVRNGRLRILKTTKFHCWYCGVKLIGKNGRSPTIDHKTPLSRGGLTVDSNLTSCCRACNVEKDHMTVSEYRRFVKEKHKMRKPPRFWGEITKNLDCLNN
jgi:5-methylcytosine-specific restriction endonuclease McrA